MIWFAICWCFFICYWIGISKWTEVLPQLELLKKHVNYHTFHVNSSIDDSKKEVNCLWRRDNIRSSFVIWFSKKYIHNTKFNFSLSKRLRILLSTNCLFLMFNFNWTSNKSLDFVSGRNHKLNFPIKKFEVKDLNELNES
jgi:hypothetical protein